jgi:hypothetical protein
MVSRHAFWRPRGISSASQCLLPLSPQILSTHLFNSHHLVYCCIDGHAIATLQAHEGKLTQRIYL